MADAALTSTIRVVHAGSRGTYGAPRVHAELVDAHGVRCGHNRIARLIAALPADHPARIEGEREMARLEKLGFDGEFRGHRHEDGLVPLRSLADDAA